MRHTLSILILEDNEDDFYLLCKVLDTATEVRARILHAVQLAEALSVAGKEDLDLAIIDLDLPDSFGLDSFLDFHKRFPEIPVVVMTGHKDEQTALQAVRRGAQDFLYKGEPSATAIVRTIRYSIERQRLLAEVHSALAHVKQLQGLLPICSVCKNIRDDKGYWTDIEAYISNHSEANFSHSICPDCLKKVYPEIYPEIYDD